METLETRLHDSLRRWVASVEPSPVFVHSLGAELAQAARRRQAETRRTRHILLIGMAVLGSVASVSGVAAFLVLRRRARMQPRPA